MAHDLPTQEPKKLRLKKLNFRKFAQIIDLLNQILISKFDIWNNFKLKIWHMAKFRVKN